MAAPVCNPALTGKGREREGEGRGSRASIFSSILSSFVYLGFVQFPQMLRHILRTCINSLKTAYTHTQSSNNVFFFIILCSLKFSPKCPLQTHFTESLVLSTLLGPWAVRLWLHPEVAGLIRVHLLMGSSSNELEREGGGNELEKLGHWR